MTTPFLEAPALPVLPTIRQVLAGEAAWRVPLPAMEIVLPEGVRDLAGGNTLDNLSLRERCEYLRQGRGTKNGQSFDVNIVAATTTLVRDGGIIPLEAWREDLSLYFPDNPAILWQHRASFGPIGSVVALELRGRNESGRMLQWWRFNDVSEQSQMAHALFALGEMRAASVGFIIRAYHHVSEDELKKLQKKHPAANEWTWLVDRAELIETSAVSVGADPGALALNAGESAVREVFDELGEMYAYGRSYERRDHYAEALALRCAGGDGDACQLLVDGFAGDDDAKIIRVRGMSAQEIRTFIVSNVARVIDSEAREARDRLKANGRT